MTRPLDPYRTLGVARDASEAEIKKAYRRLAREHHPDTHPGDKAAEGRFKAVTEAYELLSDPDRRRQYDLLGASAGTRPGAGPQPFQGATGGGPAGFGVFDDLLATFLRPRAGGPGGRAREADQDAELPVEIGLDEAYTGTSLEVDDPRPGKGRIRVKIPAGIDSGAKVRAAVATGGLGGATAVTLRVTVRAHPIYTRDGADLRADLPVSVFEAIEGAEIDVPTLSGARVKIKVPPSSQGGTVLRLRGKGMPLLSVDRGASGGHGDLYLRLVLHLPESMGEDERAAWRQLGHRYRYTPRR